jgi:hypothetical protein
MMAPSFALLPLILPLLVACGDDGGSAGPDAGPDASPPDAAPPSPSCLEAVNHSDLAWIQENVFDTGCASFSVCHMGNASSAGGLNLEAGMAEAAMVNVDSTRITSWKLIVPGDPDNSYLMAILGDVEGPLTDGVGTMPFNNPTLCQQKLDSIRRWIGSLPTE